MAITKQIKDYIVKTCWDGKFVPAGLVELERYFRNNDPIRFEFNKEDGRIIATSLNFRHGTIVTSAKSTEELDQNIKDAILTAFDIPSSYAEEAAITRQGEKQEVYAAA